MNYDFLKLKMLFKGLKRLSDRRKRQRTTAMQRDNEPILYLLNTTTILHLLIVELYLRSALSLPVDDWSNRLL